MCDSPCFVAQNNVASPRVQCLSFIPSGNGCWEQASPYLVNRLPRAKNRLNLPVESPWVSTCQVATCCQVVAEQTSHDPPTRRAFHIYQPTLAPHLQTSTPLLHLVRTFCALRPHRLVAFRGRYSHPLGIFCCTLHISTTPSLPIFTTFAKTDSSYGDSSSRTH